MKRAAIALRSLATGVMSGVGLEGTFLGLGTVCLAVFASFFSPAGPWLVVGTVALVTGIALARPARKA